jgi:cytochrome c oxidase cbb3-type subunit III
MPMRQGVVAAAVAAMLWTAVHGAATPGNNAGHAANAAQAPPTGTPQPGRAGPPGRQGGGQRANFPQQQRPPGDPEVIARGRALYGVRCTACHGADLRGGDQGGPNLLRSQIILTDQKGENIAPVIREGRQGPIGTMPAFHLPESDVLAIVEYIHNVMGQAGRQGRPPERETPIELNVLVGDAASGQRYVERVCSRCHSAADLRGVVARAADARALQDLWVSGGLSGRGGRGGGGGGRGDAEISRIRVTVTPPGSAPVTGRLVRIDDFVVSLVQEDGTRRTFRREGTVPKVEIADPLEPHRRLVLELADTDMHNVTAYLATLK